MEEDKANTGNLEMPQQLVDRMLAVYSHCLQHQPMRHKDERTLSIVVAPTLLQTQIATPPTLYT